MYKFFGIFLPTKKVLLFSLVVFSNLFGEDIDETFTVLEELIEILALGIVILLSITQLIILQVVCFLFVL